MVVSYDITWLDGINKGLKIIFGMVEIIIIRVTKITWNGIALEGVFRIKPRITGGHKVHIHIVITTGGIVVDLIGAYFIPISKNIISGLAIIIAGSVP